MLWHIQTSVLHWLPDDPISCTKLLRKTDSLSTKAQVQCFNIACNTITTHIINHLLVVHINNYFKVWVKLQTHSSIAWSTDNIMIPEGRIKKELLLNVKKINKCIFLNDALSCRKWNLRRKYLIIQINKNLVFQGKYNIFKKLLRG